MSSLRMERVAGELRKALARPLSDFASETSSGFVTVTHVRVSPDLRNAKIYVSVFGGKIPQAQTMTLLETRAKEIRHETASKLKLRFMPELKFFLDDTLETMDRVNDLIKHLPEPARDYRDEEYEESKASKSLQGDPGHLQ